MKTLAIIPARGNSKGIKRKNMTVVGGQPLIYWAITEAQKSRQIDDVVVSSESPEILYYAESIGARCIARPKEFSKDDVHASVPCLHVLTALYKEEFEAVIMLLPTSPLRRVKHIDESLKLFQKSGGRAVVSVTPTASLHSHRYLEPESVLRLPFDVPDLNAQRQDVKTLYRVNGSIFINTQDNLAKFRSFHLPTSVGYVMPQECSIDVNTMDDMFLVNKLLKVRDDV